MRHLKEDMQQLEIDVMNICDRLEATASDVTQLQSRCDALEKNMDLYSSMQLVARKVDDYETNMRWQTYDIIEAAEKPTHITKRSHSKFWSLF